MSSLASLVSRADPIERGEGSVAHPSSRVMALQIALSQAGYRIINPPDGAFGPRTDMVVRQFQTQHGLHVDGQVGPLTAALLDVPHDTLVITAKPLVNEVTSLPHDDTASLIAYYGDPRNDLEAWKAKNVIGVPCPWALFYDGVRWPHDVPLHRKCADAFAASFADIWKEAGQDNASPILTHMHNYSGSGNLRPVRGSSRVSTHGFWAAIDFDAEHLPLAHRVPATEMPKVVVDIFKSHKLFWGGDFVGRADPMHVQAAHE